MVALTNPAWVASDTAKADRFDAIHSARGMSKNRDSGDVMANFHFLLGYLLA
jgi:hypothetical protein